MKGNKTVMKRTRASVCAKKRDYPTEADALAVAIAAADVMLRPYRCDRCGRYHLTSRLKGKRRLPIAT